MIEEDTPSNESRGKCFRFGQDMDVCEDCANYGDLPKFLRRELEAERGDYY